MRNASRWGIRRLEPTDVGISGSVHSRHTAETAEIRDFRSDCEQAQRCEVCGSSVVRETIRRFLEGHQHAQRPRRTGLHRLQSSGGIDS